MASIALPRELTQLAARQHGVLAGSQLLGRSFTRYRINHRVDEGLLIPLIGDTFLIAGAPVTPRARYRAATLAIRGSVLGDRAAAHLLECGLFGPVTPEVIVDSTTGHRVDGVVIKRRIDLLDRHRCSIDGIPCTTLARTVLDLAAVLRASELKALTESLVDTKRIRIETLFDEFDVLARRGRSGTTAMRLVLEPLLGGRLLSPSELESRGLAFLRAHGFPRPQVEFRPPWAGPAVGRVDVAYPDIRVVIEFDGRRWHDRSDRFEHDRLRDQLAMANGWIVVRITWRQLHGDTVGLASRLRATIASRSPSGS